MDIGLKCKCGCVEGVAQNVRPSNGIHLICYCKDCQAFASYLGREQDLLDEAGGTEIFQIAPADLRISKGKDQIRCVQLSPRLMRWYTDCCKTPIGNTMPNAKMPFAGVGISFFNLDSKQSQFNEAFGPIVEKCFGKYCRGPMPPGAKETASFSIFGRIGWFILRGLFLGKNKPSPFFDENGKPVVDPIILSQEKLKLIYSSR
ncbi:MAG: DUF6151 family protein [Proteobacteria bacterium]|nr:DUF6151 family protein [Pseudomonadota bacterium]